MGLKGILILIFLFCAAIFIGGFYYNIYSTQKVTIEIESPVQDIPQDITHLDTFITSNEINGNARITVIHDNKRNVTCYVYNRMTYGGGISCIPDSEIQSSEIDNNYIRYVAR